MTMADKKTADGEYKKAVELVLNRMSELRQQLARHQATQANDTSNWGYVGDLNHWAGRLDELLGRDGNCHAEDCPVVGTHKPGYQFDKFAPKCSTEA